VAEEVGIGSEEDGFFRRGPGGGGVAQGVGRGAVGGCGCGEAGGGGYGRSTGVAVGKP
jgi:hypothetical protein